MPGPSDGLKRDDGLDDFAARDHRAAGRQRRGVGLEVGGVNLGGAPYTVLCTNSPGR